MNNYYDFELTILSCLVQKPELMEEVILENKHFIKYKQFWMFMKAFYKKYHTFDLELMTKVASNKYKVVNFFLELLEKEPAPSLFRTYQDALIEMYEDKKGEKETIEKIYKLANDLYLRTTSLEYFKQQVNKLIK